jgi:hypothetical protein
MAAVIKTVTHFSLQSQLAGTIKRSHSLVKVKILKTHTMFRLSPQLETQRCVERDRTQAIPKTQLLVKGDM